jgi:hypothetical protein
MYEPKSIYQGPIMTLRQRWTSVPPKSTRIFTSMPNGGIVRVTPFRTLRSKEPTIDLRYMNGYLCMIDNGEVIPIAKGSDKMTERVIYGLRMHRSMNDNEVILRDPRAGLSKAVPNNMDIIKRVIASVSKDMHMATSLFDITSMSFSKRTRVYEMAQAHASMTRRAIMIFGCGRLQEWRQMRLSSFSYIAVDPEIVITRFSSNMRRVTVLPYNINLEFLTNVAHLEEARLRALLQDNI